MCGRGECRRKCVSGRGGEWRRGVEEGDVGGKEESGGRSVWERRVEKKVCEWERRRVEEGVCG